MKLRIIFEKGISDIDGRLSGKIQATQVVEIPNKYIQGMRVTDWSVIGGEWVAEKYKENDHEISV